VDVARGAPLICIAPGELFGCSGISGGVCAFYRFKNAYLIVRRLDGAFRTDN